MCGSDIAQDGRGRRPHSMDSRAGTLLLEWIEEEMQAGSSPTGTPGEGGGGTEMPLLTSPFNR